MANRDTSLSELCGELSIKPVTLYRYVGPEGQLREQVLAGCTTTLRQLFVAVHPARCRRMQRPVG